jgi:hypothetical protein
MIGERKTGSGWTVFRSVLRVARRGISISQEASGMVNNLYNVTRLLNEAGIDREVG